MATYPYTQSSMLVNSITATTVVSIISGMQVSVTTFTTSAGNLGSITLSPVQPTAVNVEFKAGKQALQIDLISFRAQFGFDAGQVTANGRATDQDGKNETAFAKQIATWS
jgi:hypothetical protein